MELLDQSVQTIMVSHSQVIEKDRKKEKCS